MHPFEYAILRIVPKVEREEFVNVGVILFSKAKGFLKVKTSADDKKILALNSELDLGEIKKYLHSFEQITNGEKNGSPISQLDIASRFRWLTATRSTVLQTSKVHTGICDDPEEKLMKLYRDYVL